jgi:hypothetical protein
MLNAGSFEERAVGLISIFVLCGVGLIILVTFLALSNKMSTRATKSKATTKGMIYFAFLYLCFNVSSGNKKPAATKKENVPAPVAGKKKENVPEPQVPATPSTPKKQGIKIGHQTASATKPPSASLLDGEAATARIAKEGASSFVSNLFSIVPPVKKVYKIIQKSTGALGGNGYDGAIYGELTMHSMQKVADCQIIMHKHRHLNKSDHRIACYEQVINFMMENCEMDRNSLFIDVGSGLGKPNFHAAQDPGVRVSVGIELEEIRWQLAMQNLKFVLADIVSSTDRASDSDDASILHGTNFMHGDIFDVATTVRNPCHSTALI